MYGIYAGGYAALLPTTMTEIYGVKNYHSVNGIIYFLRGLGSVLGAPVAGVILKSDAGKSGAGSYRDVIIYDGVLLVCSSLCIGYVRWLDAREKGVWLWKA
jgi:MFS family permease